MKATYSFLRAGSVPGRIAATFSEVTSARSTATVAFRREGIGKWGRGLSASAASRISCKVWPEPARTLSAWAGLIATATERPRDSSIDGSASVIAGRNRARVARAQGTSMFFGFWIETMPMAPTRRRFAARSAIDCMWAASGPGIEVGAPLR